MKVFVPLAAFALCLAACRARPLTSNDAGGAGTIMGVDAGGGDAFQAADTSQTNDAPRVDDAARGGDARRDLIALDTAEFLSCASDDDCVTTWYPQPVTSAADCYCRACAWAPVNRTTDATFSAAWMQYCADWLTSPDCSIHPCPAAPTTACVSGVCLAGTGIVPSACPADPNSGCQNAIACGGRCCAPGEWCDDTIGCRCGYHRSCALGQTCGHMFPSAGNTGTGLCGDTCCFDCAP